MRKLHAEINRDEMERISKLLGIRRATRKLILPHDAPCNSCISTETIGGSVCVQGDKGKPCRYWKDIILPGVKSGTIKTELL